MVGFNEVMHLRGKAEEDLYFARRDRQLVEALRRARAGTPRGPAEHPPPRTEPIPAAGPKPG